MFEQLVNQLIYLFSVSGVIVFSISGALIAATKGMDILGFILMGAVTGVGGGTLRDLLLDIPVFWVQEPLTIYLCIGSSALTYFAIRLFLKRDFWIVWMDAIGLSIFAVMGTKVALSQDSPLVVAVVMGVMSATFGGIMRDVLCADTLMLMRPEMYISCALFASIVYTFLYFLQVPDLFVVIAAFLAGFALRAAAIIFHLKLPQFSNKTS
ncbi:MAG: trimeric intracellular cation channel family protein [Oceanospirillaceae bacterium]|nr:trimeric intracellular cation channel family protein [Oceanospirillaceae bacterium]